ncbi:MAG: translation elongation factor Ts [Dehalococcoidia bacterium]|nr:translation elongation factor Ts [Dehalococcoidia bacterium]
MEISTDSIKELREKCGAGIMDCRAALIETQGDLGKAAELLKERGCAKAAKKADRVTANGLVETYIHTGGRIGAMVEINCETDFVARTEEFKHLARYVAMQIAAMHPSFVLAEQIPADFVVPEGEVVSLMEQSFIKDPSKTIKDLIVDVIARTGENVRINRFTRFEVGVYPE